MVGIRKPFSSLRVKEDRFGDVTKGRGARGGEKVNLVWVGPISSRPFDCKCLYFALKVKGKGEGGVWFRLARRKAEMEHRDGLRGGW